MGILESTITVKGQTTVPAEVRKKLNLKPNSKVIWISIVPGEVSIIPAPDKKKNQSWADSLCGKYADKSVDGVESLLEDKKEDIELEKGGFIK